MTDDNIDIEKEIDKFVEKEATKEKIDQSESIDEKTVNKQLGEMGYLWDTVIKKLKADSICFDCKKDIDFSGEEQVQVLEASKSEKGTCSFVAVCPICFKKLEDKHKKDKKIDKGKKICQ